MNFILLEDLTVLLVFMCFLVFLLFIVVISLKKRQKRKFIENEIPYLISKEKENEYMFKKYIK